MKRSQSIPLIVSVLMLAVAPASSAGDRTQGQPHAASPTVASQRVRRGGPAIPLPRRAAVLIAGKLVPAEQVGIAEKQEDSCPARHLHPQQGSSVTAFDGTVIADPDPFGCGFGLLESFKPVQVFVVDLPDADYDGIPDLVDAAPDNPDADGDGVPDGAEDPDGDGLSSAFEMWVSGTNPDVPDSDGNGNDDSVDFQLERWKHRHFTIPTIVNIYTDAGTPESAEAAVEKANIVLKLARVRLQIVEVNTDVTAGDDGSGGGVAQDGELTEHELARAFNAGRAELAGSDHKRGLKIVVAKNLDLYNQATAGASLRRMPVVALANSLGNSEQNGATIAHEFFHTATIAGHPQEGTPEHTPGNVMTPWDEGRDDFIASDDPAKGLENLTLTDPQLELVLGDGIPSLYGRPGTRESPAVKREYQRGSAVDALGDASGAGHLDLHAVDIASHTDDDDLHVLLVLGDRFPDSGDIDAVYRLRFDIDDNIATGDIAEIAGVDRTLTIYVERNGGTSGLVVGAEVRAADTGDTTLLAPAPQLHAVERIADRTTIPNLAITDLFELHVPKDVLDLSAATVPACVVSSAGATGLVDDVVLVDYDRELWLSDPTLWVPVEEAVQGEQVPFSLTGLTPNASYDLLLDDTVVHGGTLDGGGDDAGDFTIPAGHPPGFSFLTAVDDVGLFGASALDVLGELVFSDGFESGDESQWSGSVR